LLSGSCRRFAQVARVGRRLSFLFPWLVFLSMVAALYAAFLYAPAEREMGAVQRIFYFHLPAAFSAFLGFLLVFVGSVQYLRTQDPKWDRLALGAAELGVVFALIVLLTGPLWARPVWGVYWRWEPRLTSMLILFTIYAAYLLVRAYGTNPLQIRRYAAVLGILGFVNVPLVYYSVELWAAEQQLHPRKIILAPPMRLALLVCSVAFLLFFFYLLRRRVRLEQAAEELAQLQQQHEDYFGERP
jgi:heme exporter protein C